MLTYVSLLKRRKESLKYTNELIIKLELKMADLDPGQYTLDENDYEDREVLRETKEISKYLNIAYKIRDTLS